MGHLISHAFLVGFGLIALARAHGEGPLAGAIRWDAWHGKAGAPGVAVERSLGPQRWHYRLPFFAKVMSENEVSIAGNSQQVMDREIEYAAKAGLDYWAFVTYEHDDAMSLGLRFYLSSQRRGDVRFSLIIEHGRWGNRETYRPRMRRFADLMKQDTYQKVLDGRPLVYLGFFRQELFEKNWAGIEGFRKAVDELRGAVREAGLGNPYIVIMEFNPVRGKEIMDALGADAISTYATSAKVAAAPYSELTRHAANFWERAGATGAPVVPIVMAGWDRRPRVEHPVPWETWQKPGEGIEHYYKTPKPSELAAHLQDALDWVRDSPHAAAASTVIIYAWNENDEGGWLTPTLSEGTARLDAVQEVLRRR